MRHVDAARHACPGEPSPRLNPPMPPTPPICISRRASESCCAIALLPSSLPPNRPEVLESAGLCTGPITAAVIAQTAITAASRRGTRDKTTLLDDEIAVIAVHSIIGGTIGDGCGTAAGVVVHVTLRGPTELLGAVDAQNVAPAVQVFQFGSCEVDFLPWLVALLLFTKDHDNFCSIGRRRMFTMLAQLLPIAGDRPSREATPPSGRGERKAGLPERKDKVGALWAGRPSLDGHIQRKRAIALRNLAE